MPFITQIGIGKRARLSVLGDDYPTEDRTCVQDYILVVDLAKAPVMVLTRLIHGSNTGNFEVFNIGIGTVSSVLDVIHTFEEVSGKKRNYKIVGRR